MKLLFFYIVCIWRASATYLPLLLLYKAPHTPPPLGGRDFTYDRRRSQNISCTGRFPRVARSVSPYRAVCIAQAVHVNCVTARAREHARERAVMY